MREELLQERKKAIYGLICDELYVPMKAKEIAAVLNVPKSDRRDLAEVLDALVAEGKVEVSSKGKYMKSEGKFLTGVFAAHPRGFGFVTVEGEDEDIFENMGGITPPHFLWKHFRFGDDTRMPYGCRRSVEGARGG